MVTSSFTVRDGKVFYHGPAGERTEHGIYVTPAECERMLAVFRLSATARDYFAPVAQQLANDLALAMAAAGISETQREAA